MTQGIDQSICIHFGNVGSFHTEILYCFYRFLADRFVEGSCPFCNYEVGQNLLWVQNNNNSIFHDY